MIWDVTSDRGTDRVIERTAASRTVLREKVKLDFSSSELIRFEGRGMRFENLNGEDIIIYPGIALMPRPDGAFALIDLRDVRLEFRANQFIEDEHVPSDSEIVGRTWAKVNKNGSPGCCQSNRNSSPIGVARSLSADA